MVDTHTHTQTQGKIHTEAKSNKICENTFVFYLNFAVGCCCKLHHPDLK